MKPLFFGISFKRWLPAAIVVPTIAWGLFICHSIFALAEKITTVGQLRENVEQLQSRSIDLIQTRGRYAEEIERAKASGLIVTKTLDSASGVVRQDIEDALQSAGFAANSLSIVRAAPDQNKSALKVMLTAAAPGDAIVRAILKIEALAYVAIEKVEIRRTNPNAAAASTDSNATAAVTLNAYYIHVPDERVSR